MFKLGFTGRGFGLLEFTDTNRQLGTLQLSSSAMEEKIWLGVSADSDGKPVNDRLHLNREQARDLAYALMYFASTGDVPMKIDDIIEGNIMAAKDAEIAQLAGILKNIGKMLDAAGIDWEE